MSSVAENLERVRGEVADACCAAGVDPASVTIVAVSKTIHVDAIREAYDAGQREFGENRVQEWRTKTEELPDDIHWNIIGHLQTNKVKYIIGPENLLLQSLDRVELARELQKHCERSGRHIDVLIQLNLSREDTKSGVYAEDLPRFLDDIADCSRVRLRGLMTIGPNTDDELQIRRTFAEAKKIFDNLMPTMPEFRWLSMGMSHDFELAVREGSNMVRVGTAIFGARHYTV